MQLKEYMKDIAFEAMLPWLKHNRNGYVAKRKDWGNGTFVSLNDVDKFIYNDRIDNRDVKSPYLATSEDMMAKDWRILNINEVMAPATEQLWLFNGENDERDMVARIRDLEYRVKALEEGKDNPIEDISVQYNVKSPFSSYNGGTTNVSMDARNIQPKKKEYKERTIDIDDQILDTLSDMLQKIVNNKCKVYLA